MFLHYILNCDKNETISKVFWAQQQSPLKNDWSATIQNALQALGMSKFTLNELTLLKKVTLKGIVKEACKKSAKEYLLNEIKEKNMSKVKTSITTNFKCSRIYYQIILVFKRKKYYSKPVQIC